MESILIRCAASSNVGFGHLVRCRVLAEEIKNRGYNVIMIGPPSSLKTKEDKLLFTKWIPRQEWLESKIEAKFHLKLLKKFNSVHIIIDDYRSDGEHQKILRQNKIKIVQQYDASKKQYFAANFVINGSPYEKAEFYKNNVLCNDVEFLLGPKYSILRPIFSDNNLKNIKKEKKILMTFGGGNDRGVIYFILELFAQQFASTNWRLTIVVGENNNNIKKISELIKKENYTHIELIVNPKNMAEIMATCSFAIMGGGTSIFEAAYLGIPALLIPIANNQINQCIGWENLGGMKYISSFEQFNEVKFKENLTKLLTDTDFLELKKRDLKTVIDKNGYKRVLDKLIN